MQHSQQRAHQGAPLSLDSSLPPLEKAKEPRQEQVSPAELCWTKESHLSKPMGGGGQLRFGRLRSRKVQKSQGLSKICNVF